MALPNQPPKPPGPAQPAQDLGAQRKAFFDQRRVEANQNATAQGQEQNDAISRRMTAIGQAGSGAAIGVGIKARDAVENQRRSALNDIGGQEMQSQMQEAGLAEQQASRLQQESQFGRSLAEQMAAREQQGSQFGRTLGEQGRMFDVEQGNKLQQMDLARQQFAMDKDAQAFNMKMAELTSGHAVDLDIDRKDFSSPQAYDAYLRRLQALQYTRQAAILRDNPRYDFGQGAGVSTQVVPETWG